MVKNCKLNKSNATLLIDKHCSKNCKIKTILNEPSYSLEPLINSILKNKFIISASNRYQRDPYFIQMPLDYSINFIKREVYYQITTSDIVNLAFVLVFKKILKHLILRQCH